VDVRRRSGEQTVLATIRKPLPAMSPSSDRGSLYSVRGRKNSYGYEATRNVVQVIPMLQKTHSADSSTSTKEFEETGTNIEFRSPLEIDEEQEGRFSEDVATTALLTSSPRHFHRRQWSDGTTNYRKSHVLPMGVTEERVSFAITNDDHANKDFRSYGIGKGH
jgi:hypothetical protein